MSQARSKSVYGDADARRRGTLDAAAALLDEGGYAALTIRAVAHRAGTSTGLIYKYFADKHDIFVALLSESQVESTRYVAALPRDQGVVALVEAVIPEAARQWARVGRMTAVWRESLSGHAAERDSLREVMRTAEEYNAELSRALVEAAAAEGRRLVDHPAMVAFVLSGLMGISETLVNRFARGLEAETLISFAAQAITRGITAGE